MSINKKVGKIALRAGISAGLILGIIWVLGGVHEVWAQILRINPLYIIPLILLSLIDRGMMAYKWCLLLRGQGIRFPFLRALMVYCASAIWGMFLPTTVGPDVIRAYSTSKQDGIEGRVVVASIIVERFTGFISSLVLAVVSLVLLTGMGHLGDHILLVWLAGIGLLIGTVALFMASVSDKAFRLVHDRILGKFQDRPIAQKVRKLHESYRSFGAKRRTLGVFFGLTLLEQLLPILDSWLIARGMGIEIGLVTLAVALPLGLLVARLPISLDGLGVFEGVFISLLSLAGTPASQAAAIAIISRVLGTIAFLPGWFAYTYLRHDTPNEVTLQKPGAA